MKLLTEKRMVQNATPQILEALRLPKDRCMVTHELTIGHSIADIVILRRTGTAGSFWPEAPLSIAESSILASLRQHGPADAEAIAKEMYMEPEQVERLLLGRLSSWSLVRNLNGAFRTPKAWVSRSEIIAVEAKLTRWRDAIDQAVTYRRYADRAFVLLPSQNAAVASQNKELFMNAGVGLLLHRNGRVERVFPSPRTKQHAWHREFAISRIR